MSHVPSNLESGVRKIPWGLEEGISSLSLAQLGLVSPKIAFFTPTVVNACIL